MTREPKHGDVFECKGTHALYTVIGVQQAETFGIHDRWSVVMLCVVGPDVSIELHGFRPTLGNIHHMSGTLRTLQSGYTLLIA